MKVKAPPLLTLPPKSHQPWLKVDEGRIEEARKNFLKNVLLYSIHPKDNQLRLIVEDAGDLQDFGINTREEVKKVEPAMRRKLVNDAGENQIASVLAFAANMSRLGFDVSKELRENAEKIMKFLGESVPDMVESFPPVYLSQAKQAGIDVSKWLKGKELVFANGRKIKLEKILDHTTESPIGKLMLADALHTLGVDATKQLEKSKNQIVDEVEKDMDYLKYTSMLKKLGLLDYRREDRHQPQMPPLKEVNA